MQGGQQEGEHEAESGEPEQQHQWEPADAGQGRQVIGELVSINRVIVVQAGL